MNFEEGGLRNTHILLKRRPHGYPTPEDFECKTTTVHPLPGGVLIRALYLSVDPYLRELMGGLAVGDVPAYELGQVSRTSTKRITAHSLHSA